MRKCFHQNIHKNISKLYLYFCINMKIIVNCRKINTMYCENATINIRINILQEQNNLDFLTQKHTFSTIKKMY
jgi:hypothetical protein